MLLYVSTLPIVPQPPPDFVLKYRRMHFGMQKFSANSL